MKNSAKPAIDRITSDRLPWWQRPFVVDLRSLALVRIGVGLLLLCDLFTRWPDLAAHYSDSGVLPRVAMETYFNSRPGLASLHMLFGSVQAMAALFAIAAAIATAFTAGYRTKVTGFLSLVLLCSLHARNPFVLSGGDSLLRMLLFWMLFLPVGARFSIDFRRNSEKLRTLPDQHFSMGAAALLLQMAFVYWFSAILKDHPSWRSQGDALFLALSIDQFATPFGRSLLAWPEMLRVLTLATFWFEVFGPILAFVTVWGGRVRMFAVAAFLVFHLLALNLTLELGLFPWICAAGWMAFVPTRFWQETLPAVAVSLRVMVSKVKNRPTPVTVRKPKISSAARCRSHPLVNAMALAALMFVLCWNIRTTDFERHEIWFPRKINVIAQTLRIEQYWSMFAPYPMHDDGWFVARGLLSNGEEIDLISGTPMNWQKPARITDRYPSERWRKYSMTIREDTHRAYRGGYVRWLIRRYEEQFSAVASPSTALTAVELIYMREDTLPDLLAEATPRPVVLYRSSRPGFANTTPGESEKQFVGQDPPADAPPE